MRRTILALLAVVSLTACGSTPNPAETYKTVDPRTIVADAYAALQQETSLRAVGTRSLGKDDASFDLRSDKAGNVTGTFTLHLKDGTSAAVTDVKLDVIAVGGHVYLRGGADFWGKALPVPALVDQVANKWVIDVKPLSDTITDLSLPGRLLVAKGYGKQTPTVLGIGNVDGTPTVKLSLKSNDIPVTVDVAATSPHRILKIDAGDNGGATFSDFGAPVTVSAPTSYVDLSKLALGK